MSSKKIIEDRLNKLQSEFEKLSCDLIEDDAIIATLDGKLYDDISCYGKVSDIEVSPTLSAIVSGVAVPLATVNKKRKFGLSLKDRYGSPVNGEAPVVASVVRCSDGKKVEVVVSKEDQCTLTCTPDTVGEYELSVKVRGTHIKNSPYRMWARQERDLCSISQQHVYDNTDSFGVAVHSNGDIFASTNGGYIQVYSKDGSKKMIGTSGSGDGQFDRPRGIALVGDIMYVADRDNNRVQKLTITGEYIGQFGGEGSGEGQLSYPRGIAYDGNDYIMVLDRGNQRVAVFALDGTFIRTINCDDSIYIAVDSDGHIHVPLRQKNVVQVFSSDGTKLYDYDNKQSEFDSPKGIAIDDNGYRYIVASDKLHILDQSGNQVNVIDLGFSNDATDMALDKEGYLYLADFANERIIKY